MYCKKVKKMMREKEDNAKNYNKVEKITRSVKRGVAMFRFNLW